MKIEELGSAAPQWLREAKTMDADVDVEEGYVIWWGGTWEGGVWNGGVWKGGVWWGGVWEDGSWWGGTWKGGVWNGGTWWGGIWKGGTWKGGVWKGGIWEDGYIGRHQSTQHPLVLAGLDWMVVAGSSHLTIGCQQHTFDRWEAFSDDDIAAMHPRALEWWVRWKPVLLALRREPAPTR